MKRHIHAELMMQYAQDAMETDKPWERWEFYGSLSEGWMSVEAAISPVWWPDVQYRRKPKPYEPTLLDQALELEIEAMRMRRINYNADQPAYVELYQRLLNQYKSQRSPAMIEHLKSQGEEL